MYEHISFRRYYVNQPVGSKPNPAQLDLFTATLLLTDIQTPCLSAPSAPGLKRSTTPPLTHVVSRLIKPPGGRNVEGGEVASPRHPPPPGSVTSTPLITPGASSTSVWAGVFSALKLSAGMNRKIGKHVLF